MAKLYPISTAHNHDEVYAKIGEGGITDHGLLTGLEDNDHPQYLLAATGKAADSDKLDGIDSTGFVKTSGTQTIADVKTFSSIPVLPASNPTTSNQAVRKGYADASYLGISSKAADSDKLDGLNSTDFGRPVFLTTPLTSTSWDGDNKTSANNGIIDLSAVFGVPSGVKAALVSVQQLCNTANAYIRLGPTSSSPNTIIVRTPAANVYGTMTAIIPCDSNGDIYFSTSSGVTLSTQIWIWGYWL